MTTRPDEMHSIKYKNKEKHLEITPTSFIVDIRQTNALFLHCATSDTKNSSVQPET